MHQTYSKRRRPRKPRSLLDFIRDIGGIDPGQPEAGDLRSMDAHRLRSRRFVNKLIRPKAGQGRMVDDVCSLAIESGYLPEGSDINDLLSAIDLEIRGIRKCYPLADVDAVPLPLDAEAPEPLPIKRGVGRPPKPTGALVHAPSFRIGAEDLEALYLVAHNLGMPVRTFARKCLLTGLQAHNGEGF